MKHSQPQCHWGKYDVHCILFYDMYIPNDSFISEQPPGSQFIVSMIFFFSFSDAINIDAVISIIDNYSNVMNYTNSSWKLNKIFPKSKEKGWTAKRLRIVIKSLVTNRVYGHLFVNTVNKVNSLLAWHVHTCLPWWQRVRILIMIMIFSFSIFFFIIKHILQVALVVHWLCAWHKACTISKQNGLDSCFYLGYGKS